VADLERALYGIIEHVRTGDLLQELKTITIADWDSGIGTYSPLEEDMQVRLAFLESK
jgi:hypothetical protein